MVTYILRLRPRFTYLTVTVHGRYESRRFAEEARLELLTRLLDQFPEIVD